MLELDAVTYTYRGAAEAVLKDLSLNIRPGEMVAALGAHGAGISTLCRLAAGLLKDHGRATGDVSWPASGAQSEDRSGAAMLGDDPEAQLTGMTGFTADEVQLPGRLSGAGGEKSRVRAQSAMTALQISDLADRRLETLSGGERQLTALAGLLTLNARLLVLDQPSLALDPGARSRLISVLKEHCAAGGAVLIGSHQYDDVVAACHRGAILDRGRIAHAGRVTELSTELLAAHGIWNSLSGPAAKVSAVGRGSSRPGLGVSDLQVRLGDRKVLERARLSADAGTITAVLGANGAGKSTLLRAIAGLVPRRGAAVDGEIWVADRELTGTSAFVRAPHVGWVGQDAGPQLLASSVRKELEHALPRRRARGAAQRGRSIEEVVRAVGLCDVVDEHPYDLPLSQRKDLVIATAMLMDPPVLLLDEPTLARDYAAMQRLTGLVETIAGRGVAVVLTTHDRWWAESVADQMLHLEAGQLS